LIIQFLDTKKKIFSIKSRPFTKKYCRKILVGFKQYPHLVLKLVLESCYNKKFWTNLLNVISVSGSGPWRYGRLITPDRAQKFSMQWPWKGPLALHSWAGIHHCKSNSFSIGFTKSLFTIGLPIRFPCYYRYTNQVA
jgi:hypothetical protein